MDKAIIDASAVMAALLPGEPTRPAARRILEQFAQGTLELEAPTLLPYELANSLLKAERKPERGVAREIIDAILEELALLAIPLSPVPMVAAISAARRYSCWAYDASYLALAERESLPLLTADRHHRPRRLFLGRIPLGERLRSPRPHPPGLHLQHRADRTGRSESLALCYNELR